MTPGRATYRISDLCVWPQRRGLTCRRVMPDDDDLRRYPFSGLGKYEWVVVIDDDPLVVRGWWTCVMDRRHLEQIGS